MLSATTAKNLPSIHTLPLPDEESKSLCSRAVRLLQRSDEFKTVGVWLDANYSERAIYEAMLPEKKREWDRTRRDLTAAPTKGELDSYITRDCFCPQRAHDWAEHRRQHRQARELKHPKYDLVMDIRHYHLRALRCEQANWRPCKKTRLMRAVADIVDGDVEYPDDPDEHFEHSKKIVALAALLTWSALLHVLGEFGRWPWNSEVDQSTEPTGDEITDLLRMEAQAMAQGPHKQQPGIMHPRTIGRNEVLFIRMPGEPRSVNSHVGFDPLLKLLRVAVDELESADHPSAPAATDTANAQHESDPLKYKLVGNQIHWGKVNADLTKKQYRIMEIVQGTTEVAVQSLMSREPGAVWRETFSSEDVAKVDRIRKALDRLSNKLSDSHIRLRVKLSADMVLLSAY